MHTLLARLPPLVTLPLALGSMYVLEGATLGGQVVSRHLARALGTGSGLRFFASYGPEVGAMWRGFGDVLASHAGRDADDAMVHSAQTTFLRLHEWLLPVGALS